MAFNIYVRQLRRHQVNKLTLSIATSVCLVAIIVAVGCKDRQDSIALFNRYVQAVNAHDLEILADMTAPDAV